MSRKSSIAVPPLRPVALGLRSIVCGVVTFAALWSATALAYELRVDGVAGAHAIRGAEDIQPFDQVASTGPLVSQLSASSTGIDSYNPPAVASAQAYAYAAYGILKTRASAANNIGYGAGVDSTARFSDYLFIHTAPELDGEPGLLSIDISVNWEMLFSGPGTRPFALAEAYLRVGSSIGDLVERLDCSREYPAPCYPVRTLQINGADVPVPSPMGFTLDVPIVFGQGLLLYGFLQASASALGLGEYHPDLLSYAAVAADHSFYWGGIDTVSYQGSPVSFTVTSDSGTDYARSFVPVAAIPTPATLYLVVPAILAMAGRRYRLHKKTKNRPSD